MSRLRWRTFTMSIVTRPVCVPNSAAWRATCATPALQISFLLGMQLTFGHEPPIHCRSTTAVRRPDCARCQASSLPPAPLPRMSASSRSGAAMPSSRSEDISSDKQAGPPGSPLPRHGYPEHPSSAVLCYLRLGRLDQRRLQEIEGEHAHSVARCLLGNGDLEVSATEGADFAAEPLHALSEDLTGCVEALDEKLDPRSGRPVLIDDISAELRSPSPLERLPAHREIALPLGE